MILNCIKGSIAISLFIMMIFSFGVTAQSSLSSSEGVEKSIILLFDSTGSMADNNKIENAKIAAKNVFRSGAVKDNDEVALIVFDACNHVGVVIDFTTDKSAFISKIDGLSPKDGTPLYQARDFAKDYMLKNSKGRVRKIIMFTDGMETCK